MTFASKKKTSGGGFFSYASFIVIADRTIESAVKIKDQTLSRVFLKYSMKYFNPARGVATNIKRGTVALRKKPLENHF